MLLILPSGSTSDTLLHSANILTEDVVGKYRTAGEVAQACMQLLQGLIRDLYHLGTAPLATPAALCHAGDAFLEKTLAGIHRGSAERGIAYPVTVCANAIVANYAPETDDPLNAPFSPGDVVTLLFGCHVDGYTAWVAHTEVIYPAGAAKAAPLVGRNADAVCAANTAVEAVTQLLSTATNVGGHVTGAQVRALVDSVATAFRCVVVPGSKVRRIRRFLAGQAEGVVAEREFQGVVWLEANQEQALLQRAGAASTEVVRATPRSVDSDSAVPSDDFVVLVGEVYMVDLAMAPVDVPGIVTLETLDEYTGKNHRGLPAVKPTIFIRDHAVVHQLKLAAAREVINIVDKRGVFPFRASHLGGAEDMLRLKLGLAEVANRRLVVPRNVQAAVFIPLQVVLEAKNPTGAHGVDAERVTLPGAEVPLPALGMLALRLRGLVKKGLSVGVVREGTTVVVGEGAVRLTGGEVAGVPWVRSECKWEGSVVGGKVKVVKPGKY